MAKLKSYLRNLRKKPEKERKKILILSVTLACVLIAIVYTIVRFYIPFESEDKVFEHFIDELRSQSELHYQEDNSSTQITNDNTEAADRVQNENEQQESNTPRLPSE